MALQFFNSQLLLGLAASPNIVKYFERHFVQLKGYPQPLEAWLTSYEKLSQYLFEVGEIVP